MVFVPGFNKLKRPNGRVSINRNNQIANKLSSLVYVYEYGAIELVSQQIIPLNGSNGLIKGQFGEVVASSSDSSTNYEKVLSSNILESTDSFSIFCRAYSNNSDATTKRPFAAGSSATDVAAISFGVTGNNSFRVSCTVTGGVFPGATITGITPESNKFYNLAGARKTGDSNTWNVSLDGRTASFTTANASTNNLTAASNALALCGGLSNTIGLFGGVAIAGVFNTFLSQDELNAITEYPYQLVKSEPRIFSLGGTATTITGLVGDAVANGGTASLNRTVVSLVGDSVADGAIAALNRAISASAGDAVANGSSAVLGASISAQVGDAVADGGLSSITRTISGSVGNAVANGSSAYISSASSESASLFGPIAASAVTEGDDWFLGQSTLTGAGSSVISFVGEGQAKADLSSDSISTVNFFSDGAGSIESDLAASGAATASFVSTANSNAALSSAGIGSASFVTNLGQSASFSVSGSTDVLFNSDFTALSNGEAILVSRGVGRFIARTPEKTRLPRLQIDPYYPMNEDYKQLRTRLYDTYRQIAIQCNKIAEEIDKLNGN